jgi:hypothetical protein
MRRAALEHLRAVGCVGIGQDRRYRSVLRTFHDPADIERAFSAIAAISHSGVFVMSSAFISVHRGLIISLAARHHLELSSVICRLWWLPILCV